MTDGIGRLSGYGNYGVGGYIPQRKEDVSKESDAQKDNPVVNNYEDTQVDPSMVMEFLSNNNLYVAAPNVSGIGNVDSATQDRVASYMEQFEMIYGIVQEEFGEEFAPDVMDVVMDKLMSLSE